MTTTPEPAGEERLDPVVARRRRIARVSDAAQRAGYSLFGLAIGAFVVGIVRDFPQAVVTVVLVSLGLGSVLLAPSIVVGYAVKAAERDDRERGFR